MQKMKFRKKPISIEAYQTDKEMIIHTLEGDMLAHVGDWIITGVNGEQYPCKPDIFEKTYEFADSESVNTYEIMWNDLKSVIQSVTSVNMELHSIKAYKSILNIMGDFEMENIKK